MKQFRLILLILVGFNIATIILYLFPPVVRQYSNSNIVVLYLSISVMLIYKGLKKGYANGESKFPRILIETKGIIKFLMFFYCATFLFKYGYFMGLSPFDIQGMIAKTAIGIASPDVGYMMSLEQGISPVPWALFFFISIFNDLFFIIMFCSWEKIGKFFKFLVIIFTVIDIYYWLGRGTNFGLISMITNALFSYFLKSDSGKSISKIVSNIKTYIIIGVAIIGSVTIFSYLMVGRTGEGDSSKSLSNISANHQIDYNNPVVKALPDDVLTSYYFIYSYCCQGYEALGKSFDVEPCWTWGVGNNPRLSSLAKLFTGYDAAEHSYMASLEKKYQIDPSMAWHSAYLWWANDFSILGALIIIYILSYLCGCAVSISIKHNDLFSKIVAVVLANMILFLFANNNYLSLCFYSAMFLFPYWYFTRIRNK